jgi:hypothetical protein
MGALEVARRAVPEADFVVVVPDLPT